MPERKRKQKKKIDAKRSSRRVKKSNKPKPDESLVTIDVVAKMLQVDVEVVRRHISAGAPIGPNGSVNLIHYTAWLIREIAGGD